MPRISYYFLCGVHFGTQSNLQQPKLNSPQNFMNNSNKVDGNNMERYTLIPLINPLHAQNVKKISA
jgi:hypothetical protein